MTETEIDLESRNSDLSHLREETSAIESILELVNSIPEGCSSAAVPTESRFYMGGVVKKYEQMRPSEIIIDLIKNPHSSQAVLSYHGKQVFVIGITSAFYIMGARKSVREALYDQAA